MFLEELALALTLLLRGLSLWFLAVALFAMKRPRPIPVKAPELRFACLIPARNEEAVIAQLVESLNRQNYPPELRDIYVIPNNCTDWTEDRARAAGAKIFRCFEPVGCKGDALHEAVAWLLPQGYDAFCVFDADNAVDPDFLARMNDALLSGARAAKGAMRVKNPGDSWTAGCYGLYFTLFDTFFNRARANCGLSAKLVGTGFAVRRDLLEELGGWNTQTMAEDAEFSAQCAALGERVWYVPGAVTYDEAPNTLRLSLRQRRRWCSGVMTVAGKQWGGLLRAVWGRGGARAADMLAFLTSPFVQALSVAPAVLYLLAAVQSGSLAEYALAAGLGLGAAWAGMTAFALVLARIGGYPLRTIGRSVAGFSLFMASWLPLQVLSLFCRSREWKAIRHTGGLPAEKLARGGNI
ncbi:MAG: glycosyltransferase family 2 protein [Candidatus Enterenecus sp.]